MERIKKRNYSINPLETYEIQGKFIDSHTSNVTRITSNSEIQTRIPRNNGNFQGETERERERESAHEIQQRLTMIIKIRRMRGEFVKTSFSRGRLECKEHETGAAGVKAEGVETEGSIGKYLRNTTSDSHKEGNCSKSLQSRIAGPE